MQNYNSYTNSIFVFQNKLDSSEEFYHLSHLGFVSVKELSHPFHRNKVHELVHSWEYNLLRKKIHLPELHILDEVIVLPRHDILKSATYRV